MKESTSISILSSAILDKEARGIKVTMENTAYGSNNRFIFPKKKYLKAGLEE